MKTFLAVNLKDLNPSRELNKLLKELVEDNYTSVTAEDLKEEIKGCRRIVRKQLCYKKDIGKYIKMSEEMNRIVCWMNYSKVKVIMLKTVKNI